MFWCIWTYMFVAKSLTVKVGSRKNSLPEIRAVCLWKSGVQRSALWYYYAQYAVCVKRVCKQQIGVKDTSL